MVAKVILASLCSIFFSIPLSSSAQSPVIPVKIHRSLFHHQGTILTLTGFFFYLKSIKIQEPRRCHSCSSSTEPKMAFSHCEVFGDFMLLITRSTDLTQYVIMSIGESKTISFQNAKCWIEIERCTSQANYKLQRKWRSKRAWFERDSSGYKSQKSFKKMGSSKT